MAGRERVGEEVVAECVDRERAADRLVRRRELDRATDRAHVGIAVGRRLPERLARPGVPLGLRAGIELDVAAPRVREVADVAGGQPVEAGIDRLLGRLVVELTHVLLLVLPADLHEQRVVDLADRSLPGAGRAGERGHLVDVPEVVACCDQVAVGHLDQG